MWLVVNWSVKNQKPALSGVLLLQANSQVSPSWCGFVLVMPAYSVRPIHSLADGTLLKTAIITVIISDNWHQNTTEDVRQQQHMKQPRLR